LGGANATPIVIEMPQPVNGQIVLNLPDGLISSINAEATLSNQSINQEQEHTSHISDNSAISSMKNQDQ